MAWAPAFYHSHVEVLNSFRPPLIHLREVQSGHRSETCSGMRSISILLGFLLEKKTATQPRRQTSFPGPRSDAKRSCVKGPRPTHAGFPRHRRRQRTE